MSDPDLLIRIDENVKYLVNARREDRAAFEDHVKEDKKIVSDYLRPLWEQRQQDIGAANIKKTGSTAMSFVITSGISIISAIAAVKAIK